MPTLAAIDVSVSDDRISLVFSHRALAAAYAAYLEAEDSRPPYAQAVPGYRRHAMFHAASKEVTLAMPSFLTWFITMRQPDDEDSVTFTFSDEDEEQARAWAESVVLFEPPVPPGTVYDSEEDGVRQLHVKRLWNRGKLLQRLEELKKVRSRVTTVCSLKSTRSSPRSSPKEGSKDGVPWYERQDYGYGYRYAGVGQTKELTILAPLPKRVALLPHTTTAGLFHEEWW
ncbi:hypothetical protein GE21DRAFT_2414 [Neurospora crassa]|uniref:Uncharacterized protein n=1 Tax=Neurospora crassa (strain ATCC 24698 / 74-OR23-1A / CBS 708.71 / DSM 1257 / FGSC 987) TaxID=367110 RepID=Q7SHM2_NEUCR|nr:hypothetical protein NCU02882 [Neurospora crassa OR74A]EAA36328.3 hypothetical protein NCU02882 [Neurospora crassa OR74A]KHE89350.1 hypothetical protein GE21DRAFT_2414 [Neurospora crassa]|eukprot:XP_965564.3 hypothetical protein NCU02882 [Neurospora crassa OR74A]